MNTDSWHGRTCNAAPLTLAWFVSATKPRSVDPTFHDLQGSPIYALTPPRERYGRPRPVRVGLGSVFLLFVLCAGVAALVVNCTKV